MHVKGGKFDPLSYSVKRIKEHECSLPVDLNTEATYILSGWLVNFRRKCKKFTMVSDKNHLTKGVLRSTRKIVMEEKRHLSKYYYMIHPFSEFSFYWDTFMAVIFYILFLLIPFHLIPSKSDTYYLANMIMFLNVFCAIHMIISFAVGYFEVEKDKIVLKPSRVAKNYIKKYFFPDLISTFDIYEIGQLTEWYQVKWYFKVQLFVKIVRVISFHYYIKAFEDRMGFSRYKFKMFLITLYSVIGLEWIVCIIILMTSTSAQELEMQNIALLYCNMGFTDIRMIFLVDIIIKYHTISEYLFIMVLMNIGKFLENFIIAQFSQIYGCYITASNRYEKLVDRIKMYVSYKEVPVGIIKRILSYINFRYQKRVFDENALLNTLSHSLQNDIVMQMCKDLLMKVTMFQQLPSAAIFRIVQRIKLEIYLPNDVIVAAGEVGNEMYLIYMGVVAIYTASGKEVCHLIDGSYFGEIALLLNEPRVASVVAIDFCELYSLTKVDFYEAIEPFPDVKNRLMTSAINRFNETMNIR